MKKLILTLSCSLLGLGATTLFAQEGVTSSGGNATGTGGSVSFSIGQVFYSSPSSATHSLVHGLQQPYEISVVNALGKNQAAVNLFASVYPNPSIDQFMLKVDGTRAHNLRYEFYDMQGRVLGSNRIESEETRIEVSHLSNAQYILKVYEGEQEIKSFKIIKVY